jgi:hypothetical protein
MEAPQELHTAALSPMAVPHFLQNMIVSKAIDE